MINLHATATYPAEQGAMTPGSGRFSMIFGQARFPAAAFAATGGNAEATWRYLIKTHGPSEAAQQVQGMFAVALSLDDGSVFLATDKFASYPLCYSVQGTEIRVAPRADASELGSSDLDPQALFNYLYFHVVPSPRTIFSGVKRLPPGHFALFRNGSLQVSRYWTPRFAPAAQASFADLKAEFRSILQGAVRRQLDGTRAACFLSGGTDSSSVAGLIAEVNGSPPATFSIGFDAAGYDEMAYARIAAKAYGTDHHEYYVTPQDLVDGIPKIATAFDQPFGNSSALPAYHCAAQAAQDGVTRLLAGDGGDELFGGNSRYATQRIFDWYSHVPSWLRRGVLEPVFALNAVSHTPLLRKGSNYIRQANTPLPGRGQEFNLLRRLGFDEVLSPDLLSVVDPTDVMAQQVEVWNVAHDASEIDKHLAYDWRYTLAENDLPKVMGSASLAGVGVGFPLLDDELLAFSMRLPANYKLRGMKLRWFFKEALRGFLPDEIITKKKHGFGLPVGPWLAQHPGVRGVATDALNSLATRGVINPVFLRELMQTLLPKAPHYYGTIAWVLVMMEHWMRVHTPNYKLSA